MKNKLIALRKHPGSPHTGPPSSDIHCVAAVARVWSLLLSFWSMAMSNEGEISRDWNRQM